MATQILVIAERVWPCGGAELATHLILKTLRDEGFGITVMTGTRNPQKLNSVSYEYCPFLDVSSKVFLWSNLLRNYDKLRQSMKGADVVYVPRLAYPVVPLAVSLDKRAIVHLHNFQPLTYSSMLFSPHDGRRINLWTDIVTSFRHDLLEHRSFVKAIASSTLTPLNRLVKRWICESDSVVCVSRTQCEAIRRQIPELRDRLTWMYNPLPAIRFSAEASTTHRFLYTGGDSYSKGYWVFREASRMTLREGRDAHFIVAGNLRRGPRLNRHPAYEVIGRLSHGEMSAVYARSTGLIFPSICEEPLPYSVLEAMLAGILPVASRVGGIPEIVEHTPAEQTLFAPGNARDCASKIGFVIQLSPEERVEIGRHLRDALLRRISPKTVRRDLSVLFS